MSVIKVKAKQLVVLSVPPTIVDYSDSDNEESYYDMSGSSPILSPVSNRYSSTFRRSISASSLASSEDYTLNSSSMSPPSSPSTKDYRAAQTPFHRRSIGRDMPPCPPIPQQYLRS
ncbi:hypothetical protein TRVA0_001S06216 [Trichomonascus vanleenenianus]|uniref:uncharacterized protein n=1 Tax=Trichomonascus vanleenenianus TaxID=2268995 RepID=UPI003ECA7B1B